MVIITMFDTYNNSRKYECRELFNFLLDEENIAFNKIRSYLDKEIISEARDMCQEGYGNEIRVYVHDYNGVICEYFIQFDRLTYYMGKWEDPIIIKNSKPDETNLFNESLVIDEEGNLTVEPKEKIK